MSQQPLEVLLLFHSFWSKFLCKSASFQLKTLLKTCMKCLSLPGMPLGPGERCMSEWDRVLVLWGHKYLRYGHGNSCSLGTWDWCCRTWAQRKGWLLLKTPSLEHSRLLELHLGSFGAEWHCWVIYFRIQSWRRISRPFSSNLSFHNWWNWGPERWKSQVGRDRNWFWTQTSGRPCLAKFQQLWDAQIFPLILSYYLHSYLQSHSPGYNNAGQELRINTTFLSGTLEIK